jgi:serine/threonine-protein kinase
LSLCHTFQSFFGFLLAQDALPKAEDAARRALERDDSLALAHVALGRVRGDFYWDWEGARREFHRALELNPRNHEARSSYAVGYLTAVGRCGEAVVELRRLLALDPLSLRANRSVGEALYFDRQYDEAIRQFQQTVGMAPEFNLARNLLSMAYASNDMPEEAFLERHEIFRRTGREKEAQELEAAFKGAGEPGILRWYIQRGLPRAERARSDRGGGNRAFNMSILYARLGEGDEAVRWLEEAVEERGGLLVTRAYVHPWFDSLRSDPRYREILKTMNLAD